RASRSRCPLHRKRESRRFDQSLDLEREIARRLRGHDFRLPSRNCCNSVTPLLQPISKFFWAYAGVFGKVSRPLWLSRSFVLFPSGDNSKVTNESPGSPFSRHGEATFFCGIV